MSDSKFCGGEPCSCPNTAIECTVTQCANHCHDRDYCSLEKIRVVTHEVNPTENECTDCQSFICKN